MSEEKLSEEVVTGVSEPQGATPIPNGVNIPMGETAPETPKEEPQEKILGKFESQEDLVKAYQELETKLGSKEVEPTPTVSEEGNFNFDKYSEEYANKGELSEDSYKELEELGFGKPMIDAYVAGQQALVDQWKSSVVEMAGSKEDYDNLINWASQGGVDDAFAQQFDEAVASMDKNKAQMAIEALKSMYSSGEPQLLDGVSGSEAGDVYESWAQLTADINTKLYQKDPAERERVQRKLKRSRL
tara:strand:+ start:16177 stop:16908 length:732 start_codon:yes stop_codon:yes gene_type:complete